MKSKTKFVCSECGYETRKWLGKCPACMQWNTFTEEAAKVTPGGISTAPLPKAIPLTEVSKESEERVKTGMQELDRVLGGGIVDGSLVLVGGDPGIGKSTLLLQIWHIVAEHKDIICFRGRIGKANKIKSREAFYQ